MTLSQADPLAGGVRPPLLFQLARHLIARGWPGGFAVLNWLRASGKLAGDAQFTLPDGSPIRMPLLWPQLWRADLFTYYERRALDLVAQAINRFGSPAVLVDCGADIGLYTRLLMSRTTAIDTVIAVEPNPDVLPLLRDNLADAGRAAKVVAAAVGEQDGWGRLQLPDDASSGHAAYVERCDAPTGLPIISVDSLLDLPPTQTLVMKIDVEGNEEAALRGARSAIESAQNVILQIEAHPDVAHRIGADPKIWIDLVTSLRPFRWFACVERTNEMYEQRPLSRPFFDVFDRNDIHDVVMISA